MKCIACKKGTPVAGSTTVSVDRGGVVVVVRQVPASICSTCGEEYLDAEIIKQIEVLVARAQASGADFSVQRFKAA
jgi:YgiT-type zinc finger domain-containing protein